jgi:hypothetical protein
VQSPEFKPHIAKRKEPKKERTRNKRQPRILYSVKTLLKMKVKYFVKYTKAEKILHQQTLKMQYKRISFPYRNRSR